MEKIQRVQTLVVHCALVGRCHRLCVGGGVFHQPLYLPELPDSVFVVGEDFACGRFPLREQDGLRCTCASDTALDAARATHHAELVRRR